ncbi:MAG: MmcQ/YjbR family DNA-binding protein [Cytophagaceae bacterium]|jgi:predicted DNA-binding protein (MmcQ/YjbR family)|nr:MmcQ/YjbR family DNA-binding protein [Cytophagaceae bacterium]
MNIENFRSFCLAFPGVTEETPFGPTILVFKVMGKMFAATDIDLFESINLKCDPDVAVERREQYPSVLPGYHMNKKHWNTIVMDGSIPDVLVFQWIKESYQLVVSGLPKKSRTALGL